MKQARSHFKRHRVKYAIGAVALICYWFSLPDPLFNDPTCMVLEAKDGSLLGAKIAADGQWRFPAQPKVPEKFEKAILTFEDKRFYKHPGFDPIAFGRAIRQNISTRSVVSGGSTLSMQVIRLSRKGKRRTVVQKIIEIVQATRMELSYSKQEILSLYASNAPFGGNVVGLDAASWRYYGKSAEHLSWGEAATLAVLPNSPSLVHPGRNRNRLAEKRNGLLQKLLENGTIDQPSFELAAQEPLPEKPHPLPRLAPHLLERALKEHFNKKNTKATRIRTTIDPGLQARLNELAYRRSLQLKGNEVHNLAIFVMEVASGNIIGYVGNAPKTGADHDEDVDIISAARSTGSTLKPLLYAMMLNEGIILPKSLVSDIPTQLNGYKPENYMETFDGAVPADLALSRSLNVPFIKLLQRYSVEKFQFNLKKLGLTTLHRPASHYGLTLVLGGAEGSLSELTNAYACMGRVLGHFYPYNGQYNPNDFRRPNYLAHPNNGTDTTKNLQQKPSLLSASAIWFALEAMEELERPNSQGEWERFESGKPIAWKTGTSFGFRDAWAIGISPKYAVGIWAGNADGEGRPGLIGIYTAAPILFEVFDLLPPARWFDPPYDDMKKLAVCRQSGHIALDICEKDTVFVQGSGINAPACPFHQTLHLDQTKKWQVTSQCEPPSSMLNTAWFVLPPVEEYYFKNRHPDYQPPPPFRPDCDAAQANAEGTMQLIYPKQHAKIFIPIDLDGSLGKTIFKVAHRDPEQMVYWHIDNEYIGATKTFHELEVSPKTGKHTLTLVDEKGNRQERSFEVMAKTE